MPVKRMKKVKRRRLNIKNFIKFILVIGIFIYIGYYVFNIPISHIEITGTNRLKDSEIIRVADLVNNPPIFQVLSIDIENKIERLALVEEVKVKKSLTGVLTLKIKEAKILFLKKSTGKIVVDSGKEIDDNNAYLGVPILIGSVPDSNLQDLVKGLTQIDQCVLQSINEIYYEPSKTTDGTIIDETRFKLLMNDGNTVYMNTINIKQLNKYLEIASGLINKVGDKRGILYLDSDTTNYTFHTRAV